METEITDLIGKTISKIEKSDDEILFILNDGTKYKMFHSQDCCESVTIEDIEGDLDCLIESPITQAEESISSDQQNGEPKNPESFTWTFYKLATLRGYVTIRWLGESNGYYSESVDFQKV